MSISYNRFWWIVYKPNSEGTQILIKAIQLSYDDSTNYEDLGSFAYNSDSEDQLNI